MEPAIVDRAQLQDRADRGVRRIALALLRNADAASDELRRSASTPRTKSAQADDALHDFRVAVRRLRSWTRAFHASLHGSLPRKQRRRLREIFRDTAVARDASVHLAWMRDQREPLTARQRTGHHWLNARLNADREADWIAALSAARRFDALSPLDAEAPIHRARIAAKRLRYLTEQVARLVSGGDTLVEALEQLQDTLGDLHDVHVFSARIAHDCEAHRGDGRRDAANTKSRATGILALTQRLHARARRAFGSLEREWLLGRATSFFAQVRTMADEIARLARLGTEIERKYLLYALPERALAVDPVEIRQGYLSGEHLVERIRCTGTARSGQRWTRTVKSGAGFRRIEIENDTSATVGRTLWRLDNAIRSRLCRDARGSSRDSPGP